MKWKLMNWKTNLRNQTPPSHVTVINRTTESVKSVKLQRKTYWRWKMRKKKTEKLSLYLYLFVITLLVNQSLCMYLCSVLLLFFSAHARFRTLRLVKEVKTGRPIRKRIVLSCTSFQPFYFVGSISQFTTCHITLLYFI